MPPIGIRVVKAAAMTVTAALVMAIAPHVHALMTTAPAGQPGLRVGHAPRGVTMTPRALTALPRALGAMRPGPPVRVPAARPARALEMVPDQASAVMRRRGVSALPPVPVGRAVMPAHALTRVVVSARAPHAPVAALEAPLVPPKNLVLPVAPSAPAALVAASAAGHVVASGGRRFQIA